MKAAIYSRESVETQVQMCINHAQNIVVEGFLVYEYECFCGGNTDGPKFQQVVNLKLKKPWHPFMPQL